MSEPIPVELRERDQWVLWCYETVKGRETKVPYTVRGRKASTTDPQTWASYDAVVAARDGYDGIGFVLRHRSLCRLRFGPLRGRERRDSRVRM